MPADRNSKRKAKRDPDASEDDDDFEIKVSKVYRC